MSNKVFRAIRSYLNKDSMAMIVNNVIGIVKGPLMLLLIPLYISEEMQGFWYTITSLSMLSTFADMGFGVLVSQFSAHEFSKLQFDKSMHFQGEITYLEKLASLFRYVIKWSICVCLIAYPIIMGVGVVVLNTHGSMEIWLLPWIIYMLSGGLSFIVRIIMSFFEGCGQIFKNQLNGAISAIIGCAIQVTLLVTNCGLYALSLTAALGLCVNVIILFLMYRRSIAQLCKTKSKVNYHWGKNFLSLIWRYALSWASGYFIFQIYTPLAYIAYDPILAGKVGITMTLVTACFNVSYVFIAVLVPKINMAVARRDYIGAKRQAFKGMSFSMIIYSLGCAVILLLLGVVKGHWEFADKILDRFLNIQTVAIMLIAWFVQFPINAIAVYGRAHKQEPFMVPSIVNSLLVLGSTLLIIYTLPIEFLFSGLAVVNTLIMFVFIFMFLRQKNKWRIKFELNQDKANQDFASQIIADDNTLEASGNEEIKSESYLENTEEEQNV